MQNRYAPPPPETKPSVIDQIHALRRKQWSDRSIAKHLNEPIEAVRAVLGIQNFKQGSDFKREAAE